MTLLCESSITVLTYSKMPFIPFMKNREVQIYSGTKFVQVYGKKFRELSNRTRIRTQPLFLLPWWAALQARKYCYVQLEKSQNIN